MKIVNLFPVPIGCSVLGRELSKKELSFILNQPRRLNLANTSSIDSYILDKPELAKLKQRLLQATKEYFNTVYRPDKELLDIYITQSWSNYTEPGQRHHEHTHPNSLISGVLYVSSESEADKISFYRERISHTHIVPTEWNEWNSKSWWLPADKGALLLFPSELAHAVETTQSSHTRVSLAFNTFVKGSLGSSTDLTELIL